MKSIYSIFVVAVCFSPFSNAEALNYSLWPRRPEAVLQAFELLRSGGSEREILKLVEPHLLAYGIGGKEARKISGFLNAGNYLAGRCPGMTVYTVRRGDNFFRIADRMKCPVDILMYMNGMLEPSALKVGQKLTAPPLNYRMEIRPDTKEVLVWDDSVLVASYPILKQQLVAPLPAQTKVLARDAYLDGQPVIRSSSDYPSANKELVLEDGRARITSRSAPSSESRFQLSATDANELALLIVPGNEVTVVREGEGAPRRAGEERASGEPGSPAGRGERPSPSNG